MDVHQFFEELSVVDSHDAKRGLEIQLDRLHNIATVSYGEATNTALDQAMAAVLFMSESCQSPEHFMNLFLPLMSTMMSATLKARGWEVPS